MTNNHRYRYAKRNSKQRQFLKLIDRVIKTAPDETIRARAEGIRDRVRLPLAEVLAKVPGATIDEKAKTLGMTRQAWYGWLEGTSRPNKARAAQLAEMTGYKVEDIRGRG